MLERIAEVRDSALRQRLLNELDRLRLLGKGQEEMASELAGLLMPFLMSVSASTTFVR